MPRLLVPGARLPLIRSTLLLALLVSSLVSQRSIAASATTSLTFVSVADARVREAYPNTNYGTSSLLEVDDNPRSESYLRFDVKGISGTVQSAKLRLYATDGSPDGPAVYATDNTWSETGITWNNRPARIGSATDDKGSVASSVWIEYEVTRLVGGDGSYSFVMVPTSTNGVDWSSRQTTRQPQLVLTVASSTEVTATPTGPTAEPTPTAETTPTAEPTPTAETTPMAELTQPNTSLRLAQRPYTVDSAWNTPIGPAPIYDRRSTDMVATIGTGITSDPNQYSYPVYYADASTPRWNVPCVTYKCTIVSSGGTVTRVSTLTNVPIPADATTGTGTDAQMIIIDTITGTEYDLWQVSRTTTGWTASNGSVYNVFWNGMPTVYGSRGAGVPYYAGLIRPEEILAGRIDHAIAFAYPNSAQGRCVFPASKTDGKSTLAFGIPEGARIQLDPSLTEADFDRMGLTRTGKIIARALQEYGMINIDVSGRAKIIAEDLEDNPYAPMQWTDPDLNLTSTTIAKIPFTSYRVLSLPEAYWTGATGSPMHGKCYR